MTQEQLVAEIPPRMNRMLLKLPIVFDWVEFKGETVFAGINYAASDKAGKPMMDIFYCATRALNHVVLFTTQWDKSKFSPSRLSSEWKPKKEEPKP
jgi:hypothetical protein